jgi:cytochrome c
MRKALVLLAMVWTAPALAETPHLGKPVSTGDLARWDIDIQADGAFLPPGEGTAAQGAPIFVSKCAACHGDGGRGTDQAKTGKPAPPILVSEVKLKGMDASHTSIANYWPYAPPLFGYIRAAMPWNEPRSLSDHEVYALTAYILAENRLIDPKLVLNAKSLAKVRMPNRDGFLPRFPELMPK